MNTKQSHRLQITPSHLATQRTVTYCYAENVLRQFRNIKFINIMDFLNFALIGFLSF